jgi:hypothetical protein
MKTILTLMAAGSLLATLATAQTPRYTVTDLGALGGTNGSGNGWAESRWNRIHALTTKAVWPGLRTSPTGTHARSFRGQE